MNKNLKPLFAIAYVLAFMLIQMAVQFIVLFVENIKAGKFSLADSVTLSPTALIITSAVSSIGAIALFTTLKWSPVSRQFIDKRPWSVMFWCTLAGIGLILPSMYLQDLTMPAEWPEPIQEIVNETTQTLTLIMSTTGGYAVICLLTPIAEELVFRGAALRTLLAWHPERRWLMIFLSALLFALAHGNPAQFLHPLLIGILLGWMYERTGSIIPGIIYHWVNNTAAYLAYHAYPDPDCSVVEIFGSQSRALMAVVFSLLIAVPAIYQLHLRMKRH